MAAVITSGKPSERCDQLIECELLNPNIDLEKIHEEVYKQVQDAYYTKEPFTIYPEIEGVDLSKARWSAIDNQRLLSWSPAVKEIENNQVLLIEWKKTLMQVFQ